MAVHNLADVDAYVDELKTIAARIDARTDERVTDDLKILVSRLEKHLLDDDTENERKGLI